ncbi:MAG: hypothetical protein IKI58_01080, partial [Oscillospiraceae bacterium]|nr:hypothetical protein [Oscillospiraceae bacterium]
LLREKSAKDGGLGEGKQEFSFPHYQSFVLLLTGTNCRISDFIYKLRETAFAVSLSVKKVSVTSMSI